MLSTSRTAKMQIRSSLAVSREFAIGNCKTSISLRQLKRFCRSEASELAPPFSSSGNFCAPDLYPISYHEKFPPKHGPTIQMPMKSVGVGSCFAISPGVRRMPMPIVPPIVTARPKPTPSTRSREPCCFDSVTVCAGARAALACRH